MEMEGESVANSIRPEDSVSSVGLTAEALRTHNKRLRGHKWDPEDKKPEEEKKPEAEKSSRAAIVAGPKPPDHPPPGFGMSKAAQVAKENQRVLGTTAPKKGSVAKKPLPPPPPPPPAPPRTPPVKAPPVRVTSKPAAEAPEAEATAAEIPKAAAAEPPKSPPAVPKAAEAEVSSPGLPRAFQSPARPQYRMGDAGVLQRISTAGLVCHGSESDASGTATSCLRDTRSSWFAITA